MVSATRRTTKMKIAVPKTAPMILFHSKESIAAKLPKACRTGARDDQKSRAGPAKDGGTLPAAALPSLRRSVA
jgi:hypothetical protein